MASSVGCCERVDSRPYGIAVGAGELNGKVDVRVPVPSITAVTDCDNRAYCMISIFAAVGYKSPTEFPEVALNFGK